MTQPLPGWYPDPSGKPGQMYWDGQRWVPPAGPPQNPVPAALRRRWTSLRTRTKIAAVAAVVAIPVFTVWVFIGVADSVFGSSGGHSASSGGTSGKSAPSGKSDSYKAGYASGKNGEAQNRASMVVGFGTPDHRQNCRDAYSDETANQVHPWNWDDFEEGCMQALQDHPPTKNSLIPPCVTAGTC
jgi:hypothetical protein